MNARAFENADLDEVNRWCVERGLLPIEIDTIPRVGIIVPGVAAGFLYRTDSTLGFLDGFISNPAASSAERQTALLHIGDTLAAAFTGRILLVYTEHAGIARWCREKGFTPRGLHQMFSKET